MDDGTIIADSPLISGSIAEVIGIEPEGLSFEWRIQNFLSLPSEAANRSASAIIIFCGGRWRLTVWPNNTDERLNPATGWVRLDLDRYTACGPARAFHVTVGIKGSEGMEMEREAEKVFTEGDYYYIWHDFCSRSELSNQGSRLMPENVLTIKCVLKSVWPGTDIGPDTVCVADTPSNESTNLPTESRPSCKDSEVHALDLGVPQGIVARRIKHFNDSFGENPEAEVPKKQQHKSKRKPN